MPGVNKGEIETTAIVSIKGVDSLQSLKNSLSCDIFPNKLNEAIFDAVSEKNTYYGDLIVDGVKPSRLNI